MSFPPPLIDVLNNYTKVSHETQTNNSNPRTFLINVIKNIVVVHRVEENNKKGLWFVRAKTATIKVGQSELLKTNQS